MSFQRKYLKFANKKFDLLDPTDLVRIYVAGPYTNKDNFAVERNILNAQEMASKIIEYGKNSPFSN